MFCGLTFPNKIVYYIRVKRGMVPFLTQTKQEKDYEKVSKERFDRSDRRNQLVD